MPPPIVTTTPGAPTARAMIAEMRMVQVIASAIARTRNRRSGVRNTGLLGWGSFQRIRNSCAPLGVAEGMVTVDSAALGQILDSVDLRIGVARRVALAAGGVLPLASGSATLVYVASGS